MRKGSFTMMGLVLWAVMLPVFAAEKKLTSSFQVGQRTPPYNPIHITGPDKGTLTCPV